MVPLTLLIADWLLAICGLGDSNHAIGLMGYWKFERATDDRTADRHWVAILGAYDQIRRGREEPDRAHAHRPS